MLPALRFKHLCVGAIGCGIGYLVYETFRDKTKISIDGIITFDTYQKVAKAFKKLPAKDCQLTITVKTLGGCLVSAKMITHLIANHPGNVTCVVDEYAFSAGTLIALVCDNIKMSPSALLSAMDPIFIHEDVAYACRDYHTVYKSVSQDDNSQVRHQMSDAYTAHKTELFFAEYLEFTKKILMKKHRDEGLVVKIQQKFILEKAPHEVLYRVEDLTDIVPYITVTVDS